MPIKVLVNGAFGRMGQLTVKTINDHANLELVGQTGREYDLKKSIQDSQADVVIDFTLAESVFKNAETIIAAGARPIIGTSGLTAEQIQTLQEKCAKLALGGIIAPNFSLGAVLMIKYAKEIVKYMPNVEIIEMHHNQKTDSPSGTALRTAQVLSESMKNVNPTSCDSHETVKGSRGANYCNIPIHALRLPGLLAHQQIIFGGQGETLTLRHDSLDRQCFMPGICLACEKVMGLSEMICGLENIL